MVGDEFIVLRGTVGAIHVDAITLALELVDQGAQITQEGDKLRVRTKDGQLGHDLRERISKHKEALLVVVNYKPLPIP